jgi:hypothetical protein
MLSPKRRSVAIGMPCSSPKLGKTGWAMLKGATKAHKPTQRKRHGLGEVFELKRCIAI